MWNMLMDFLNSMNLSPLVPDRAVWSHTTNGIFSPKSFRKELEKRSSTEVPVESYVWKGIAPPKVEIFCWKALKECIPKYGHTKWEPVDKELKEFIYSYLKDQKRLNWERMGFKHEDLEKLLNGSCEHISGYREQELVTVLKYLKWDRQEVTQRIFFWHLATELVYYDDVDKCQKGSPGSFCEIAKSLSDYMMYLHRLAPKKLRTGSKFQSHIQAERTGDNITDGGYFALMLQNLVTENHWDHEKKWEMISHVWIEMMIHAASRCSWKEHAQQLRHGGELLTHVGLFMAHIGLTTQIRMAEPDHSIDFNMPPPISP
ncbi:hypothetical protein PTKIN_Ptkin02bG0222100 [Pterospermum kingtungense]